MATRSHSPFSHLQAQLKQSHSEIVLLVLLILIVILLVLVVVLLVLLVLLVLVVVLLIVILHFKLRFFAQKLANT